jgi:hypothetical protein
VRLEPSFYQLYRRSRYSSVLWKGDGNIGGGQNRAEVFAVAALGFAFRHEPKFLDFFLRKVCQMPGVATPSGCEIRCQDGNQSDLAIVWPAQRVIVVEAKINADLQPHQNPTTDAFQAPPNGYGFQITQKYPSERERFYIVLAKEVVGTPKGESKCSNPQFIGFRRWGELEDMTDASALITDFLDSMGLLGIPELQLRSFKRMRLEHTTESAANMFCILEGLANRYKLAGKDRWDVQSKNGEAHFVGIKIREGGLFEELSNCVGSGNGTVGWFGYEAPAEAQPRISVWFYPQDQQSLLATQRFVTDRLGSVSFQSSDFAFCVSRDAASGLDDVSWLQNVIEKLRDRNRPVMP